MQRQEVRVEIIVETSLDKFVFFEEHAQQPRSSRRISCQMWLMLQLEDNGREMEDLRALREQMSQILSPLESMHLTEELQSEDEVEVRPKTSIVETQPSQLEPRHPLLLDETLHKQLAFDPLQKPAGPSAVQSPAGEYL